MKNPFQRKKSLEQRLAESRAAKAAEQPSEPVAAASDTPAEPLAGVRALPPEPVEPASEPAPTLEPEPTPDSEPAPPSEPIATESIESEPPPAAEPPVEPEAAPAAAAAATFDTPEPEWIAAPQPEADLPEPEPEPEPEPVAAPPAASESAYPPDEFSPEWPPAAATAAAAASAEPAATPADVSPAEPGATEPAEPAAAEPAAPAAQAEGPDAADAAIAAAAAAATGAAAASAAAAGRKSAAASIAGKKKPARGKAAARPAKGKAKKAGKPAKPKKQKTPRPKRERPKLFAWVAGAFKDPKRRPRSIVWTLAAVLGLAAVMIVALGATSTYWFCANGCHKVQDDTIAAYQASTHNKISCMACHMPVGADPVTFILHKAEALGELYLTVTNNFELPLNPESHLALEMPSGQCTQCHTTNRDMTPTKGIIIDHAVHTEKDVQCATCHNRVAHDDEAAKPVLNDPTTGEKSQPHENFMTMTACFRCHSQTKEALAPGECEACHPKGFPLKPESHSAPDFFPEGHGELGKAEAERVREARSRELSEVVGGEAAEEEKAAENRSGEETPVPEGIHLPPVDTINSCYTCHDMETFCNACHGGVEMPHPVGFKERHAKEARKYPKSCEQCHGKGNEGCNSCHHGSAMDYKYNPNVKWLDQHYVAVQAKGATACFECHEPTYCARCHVRGSVE